MPSTGPADPSAVQTASRLLARADAAFKKIPLPALLCVLVLAVLFPALGNGFVDWDDAQYVLSNPALRGSWLDALGFSPGYYHPITTLTYKAEFKLFGLNPFPYHLDSLLLHLLNCVSAFYLLAALGARRQAAFIGALLFGIHPAHVEPAAWVSGRKELLCAFFSSWALIFYLKFADRERKRYFFFSLAAFLLAVLSKPFALALPLVLLLADRYRRRIFDLRLIAEKAPYLALAVPLLFLSASPPGFLLGGGAENFSFSGLAAAAAGNAVFYAQKLVLPINLSSLYPSPDFFPETARGFLILLLAALGAGLLAKALRGPRPPAQLPAAGGRGAGEKIFFGLGFFLITLSPALPLSPPADRYAYLPALGLFFLYAEFILWLYGSARSLTARRVIAVAAAVHLLVLAAASARRVPVWRTSLTLWEDVVVKYPLEFMGYYGRGNAFASTGESGRALQDFTRALELSPRYWKALSNRGRIFADAKEFEKALADYSTAIAIQPGEPRLFLNRGNAYLLKGDPARAIKDFDSALALAPLYAPALEGKRRTSAIGKLPRATGAKR